MSDHNERDSLEREIERRERSIDSAQRALVFSHRLCWITLTLTIAALLGFRVFDIPSVISVRADAATTPTPGP